MADYGITQISWRSPAETILRASNLGASDEFGTSVAISGNYAIVGALNEDGTSLSATTDNCGAAYIFERNADTGVWSQKQVLRASNLGAGDNFGKSVAISGDYAIVGASLEDGTSVSGTTTECGAAYIFERNVSGNWVEKKILRASNLDKDDRFGESVAISGNYAIISATWEDSDNTDVYHDSGAVYIFERSDSTPTGVWNQKTILRSDNIERNDYFGTSVSISGTYAIVSTRYEDGVSNAVTNCGAAYIFERSDTTPTGTWSQKPILRASNLRQQSEFGSSVSISGTYAIIGARAEDGTSNNTQFNSGAAYIFERSDTTPTGTWSEKKMLRASNIGPLDAFSRNDEFGISVAISGNYAIVGANLEDGSSNNRTDCGAAYIFERDINGNWAEISIIRASNFGATDNFGNSVAISGNYAIVGANLEDGTSLSATTDSCGVAYIYSAVVPGLSPTPLSFINNSLTITNSINSTDSDPVSFVLTAGSTLYPFSVTSFSGTGTVTYTLDISGGSNIKTGTFSAINFDLLAGIPLTASGNTTYNLTLSANAAITYTIVGFTDYGTASSSIITWSGYTETILRATDSIIYTNDSFGEDVAISENYAIVGARRSNGGTYNITDIGNAYIFERNISTGIWSQTALLRFSDYIQYSTQILFGESVAISGNYAIVGASRQVYNGITTGSAYIFERNVTTGVWSETAILRASNAESLDLFGLSVAISGNYAIVGARSEDGTSGTTDSCGAAYIFERDGSGNWIQKPTILRASNLGIYDEFGTSVAISGNYAIVGAPSEDGTSFAYSTDNCGAAYIFERDGSGNWIQKPTILRASNLEAHDKFGESVAISGNYAIVGAQYESGAGNTTGNGGAAYIFERDGSGNWIQKPTILRGSNLGSSDLFGTSVSISGNYAVVGAYREDGSSADLDINSGAVYIFERDASSGNWNEKNIIRASNLGQGDWFGYSVAISGMNVIVGSLGEDGSSDTAGNVGAAYIYKGIYSADPTPISFSNNTITLTNTIGATDVDAVSFQLSSGAILYPFSVTGFTGTGTVSYALAISGGANIKNGTFSAANFDLLAGVALTASGNTTYILTLTATAAITYTIVGSLFISPTNITLSNNSVNELQPIGTVIGTLTCDNPNTSLITYSVSDTTRFSITGSTLKTNVIFDFETTSSYAVTITASIGGLTSSNSMTVLVTNISGEAAELRRQNLQGPALKTAADSQTIQITAANLKAAGYNLTELISAVYNATQLKAAAYTATELRVAGFNITQLKDALFNATELKTALFTATELKDAGFTAAQLKTALFTATELRDAGFNATQLKEGGFTATQLKDPVFNATQLKDAGFTAAEMKEALFTAVQLNAVGFTAAEMKSSFNATELKAGGYNATVLKTGGFTAAEMKSSFNATELKTGGYNATELKTGGFTAAEMKSSFTAAEMKSSFNATELKTGGFTAAELKIGGFTATEMKSSFNATELKTGGYDATELKDGGFTAAEMKSSFNATELKTGGYNATELKTGGFTAAEMKSSFTAAEMKSSFNATELKTGGYNATELKTGGFTATEMKSSFNATELKTGGYDATQLIDGGFLLTELKTAAFTAKNLKDANVLLADLINIDYNATELNDADFTATELKDSGEFTINDLKDGGYTATEMKTAQYDATQLKTVGYSATQMKDAAFTATELYSVGYTSTQLVFGGFNSSSLIILGIVPDWNINENANCITTSYVQDFVDVSGCIILRENANLHMHGKLETEGNLLLNRMFVTADASFNRRIFVGGDVSMNGKVAVSGDIYMNGNVTKCSFNNSSIPKSTFAGAVPDGPNYNTSKIVYDQTFQANDDVSMNGATFASNNVTVSGNIVFGDGTVMNTYDNNILTASPKVFNASTFTALDICGNLVAGSYATSSDYRIKTNIVELDETYTVDKLRPVKYFQTQINREKYGLIAHELQEHYPDLVIGEKDGSELQRVNYTGLIAILINEIKRMKRELTKLETDVVLGNVDPLI